jgi:hypothetical protein
MGTMAEDRILMVSPIGVGKPGTPGFRPSHVEVPITVPPSLTILKEGEKAPPRHGVFRVMTKRDGDKRVTWDTDDLFQIADAERMFTELVEQGLVPYHVGVDGRASADVMDVFDPNAGEVIFLPVAAVAGG